MTAHKWQFTPRFRRRAFGWRSDTPKQRIKEALTEIKQVARKEPALGAEGAVTFLEKLSPALEQVDSSSGALGTAVNRAIDTLVPIIAKPKVDTEIRQDWLDRLWNAIQEDRMPYIEKLADYWGELCATEDLASVWADDLMPMVKQAWRPQKSGDSYFNGTIPCLAALYTAGRHSELLALLEIAPFKWWHYRRWGVQALIAQGRKAEALRYAEESRGLNQPDWQIVQACEGILLSSGMPEEAYHRYALEANPATTNLARFRSLTKKYPTKNPETILRDLIDSTPGEEGKWFAAAKDASLFDLAIELARQSPTDPRTLTRAARDFVDKQPGFAYACGVTALHWIALGYGYEITGTEVLDAYTAVTRAAPGAGVSDEHVKAQLQELTSAPQPGSGFVKSMLSSYL